ncbi:copper transpport protein [Rhizina undulata]
MEGMMHDHSHSHMAHVATESPVMETMHRCQMSMLFTWNTQDLCLVFRWWHVSNLLTLIISLLAVVALGAGYEFVRELSRRYEAKIDLAIANEESSSLLPGSVPSPNPRTRRAHAGKSLCYAVQVFYSFFIM